MTPEETAIAINKLSDLIAANIPDMTQDAATQTKSLIQERVQEFGQNAEEQELNAYSDSYAKRRNKKGLQTSHTDLTFTGDMWRGTRIISSGAEGKNYVVEVGGASQPNQNKLNWNSERYGDILKPSQKEQEKAALLINDRLVELIKEAGL